MKKHLILIAVFMLLLSACGHGIGYGDRTMKLEIGMEKAQAQEVMGDPDRTEAYLAGQNILEAWFYPVHGLGFHGDYLSLDFKNGKLVGWGEKF